MYASHGRGGRAVSAGLVLRILAGIARDESEDRELCYSAAHVLLDFPRPQYRALLEQLAAQQEDERRAFDMQEICDAYEDLHDKPDWARFDDPLDFYSAEAVAERQAYRERGEDWDEANIHDMDSLVIDQPYVRETPKVGRNDPCPCGSGKKYKKCCLLNGTT